MMTQEQTLDDIRIGNYTLRRRIGEGGTASVYEAEQISPRRLVALKILRTGLPSKSARMRFVSEARHLAKLQHPHIAQIFESGTHNEEPFSLPFYSMELVRGGRPISRYADEAALDLRRRLTLFLSVCEATEYAHRQGIFHCDLKPANVLVDQDGAVKVIDFGIALAVEGEEPTITLTETAALRGTLQYMSPEQLFHTSQLDARSDVYALGMILYQLACGKLPYSVDAENVIAASRIILHSEPAPPRRFNPEISRDLEAVILKCLEKSPDDRYPSAGALRDEITLLLEGLPVQTTRRSRLAAAARHMRRAIARHRLLASLFIVPIVAFASYKLGDIAEEWKLGAAYEKAAMVYFPHFAQAGFPDLRMVAINDGYDLEQIARSVDAKPFDANYPRALRAVHGKFMQRLADADIRARAIVWDITFREGSDFDAPFADGVRALHARGIPVVVAIPYWTDQPPAASDLSPEILQSGVRYGGASASLTSDATWFYDVAWKHASARTQPSVALQAAAAHLFPGLQAQSFELFPERIAIDVSLGGTPSVSRRLDLSALFPVEADNTRLHAGMSVGDTIAAYQVEMPKDDVIEAATIDYAQVLNANPDQLREWFNDRVVLIGDGRTTGEQPQPYLDGRQLRGFVGQAVAAQRLIANQPVRTQQVIHFWFGFVAIELFVCFGSIALAILTGALTSRQHFLRLSIELFFIAALIAGSFAAYRYAARFIRAGAAIPAFVVTCECVAAIKRTRLPYLGGT